MSVSMHATSVPVFVQGLSALSGILDKAQSHAEARKIDPALMAQARLSLDMFPLTRQIQICTDQAKGGVARLTGSEIPVYQDTEQNLADLKGRIAKTIDYLKGFKPQQFEGSEARDITLQVQGQPMHFKGGQYLLHWVLPNYFFHLTTAYAILRHNGVEIGKRDFLGKV